tara:strand:- start:3 stop:152 length:150 start_codon:yes stop_codon:yes gene_type:complete
MTNENYLKATKLLNDLYSLGKIQNAREVTGFIAEAERRIQIELIDILEA